MSRLHAHPKQTLDAVVYEQYIAYSRPSFCSIHTCSSHEIHPNCQGDWARLVYAPFVLKLTTNSILNFALLRFL